MSKAEELAKILETLPAPEFEQAATELRRLQAENDLVTSELARQNSSDVGALLAERSTLIWESEHIKAENEALRKDAERYRHLRNKSSAEVLERDGPSAGCWIDCEDDVGNLVLLTGHDADDLIAAALKGTP